MTSPKIEREKKRAEERNLKKLRKYTQFYAPVSLKLSSRKDVQIVYRERTILSPKNILKIKKIAGFDNKKNIFVR